MEREKKPIDVKAIEAGKKLKVVEAGAGLVIGLFNPVLGAGIIVGEGLQWYAGKKYVDWRMKNKVLGAKLQKAA